MPRARIKDLPEFTRPREKLVERGPEACPTPSSWPYSWGPAWRDEARWSSPAGFWRRPGRNSPAGR
jgi:hypothetical protein